ncbi:condensation domain-containing protein [Chitinophaga pinensis]|uniref:Condensation domain protein n=1 Tax=Chitinophaga pinensis (strain ATCC 43595 / DSM 2588 / LMG 13176 / NBRC 15968 / NCIMB 11800 / UQM 2034) TaxID=485918 RepID=A0A979GS53_CHIPD|nr:condensation domain-containing protein [Chitinophaga pinensis]ACU58941.1 condensation domain protein [Chitinophaga pinensis DSM 2588]
MKRKLLLPERLMLGDGTAPFNGVYAIRINGVITAAGLSVALAKVQAKHPLLRAAVRNDATGAPWFELPAVHQPIPLIIKERTTSVDWQQEVRDAWASVFNLEAGPLINLTWLKGDAQSELILTFHHSMCDGGGGLMLVRELLAVADDPEKEIGIHPSFTTLEDIVPAHILHGKKEIFKAKLKALFIKGALASISAFVSTRGRQPISRQQDYLLHWKLDRQVSAALFQYCATKEVTVNTALCVAFLSAFKQVKGAKALNKIICPVDIRRFIPEITKDVIFSFGLSLELSLNHAQDVSFWERARLLQTVASQKIKKMNPYAFMLPFEYAHSGIKYMRKFLTYGKPVYDLMFSNMGKLDIPEQYQTFAVDTIFSPTVIGPFSNPTTIITSTYKGQIDFSFVSNYQVLDYQDALAIKEKAMALLTEELPVQAPEAALSSII